MGPRGHTLFVVSTAISLSSILGFSGCFFGGDDEEPSADAAPAATCPALVGTSWAPSILDKNGNRAQSSNHDSSVEIIQDTYQSGAVHLTGLREAYDASHVVTVSGITMSTDLLANGSLSLVAESTGISGGFTEQGGYVWPVLVSLHDGTNELINVTGCDTGGFFSGCSGSGCTAVSTCGPKSPSAVIGDTDAARRTRWERQQNILSSNQLSVNVFPTCNGLGTGSNACAFTSNFFSSGKLRTGTYTAKYVLMTNSLDNLGTGYSGSVKLSVIRKKDGNGAGTGAIDLNVIIVGSQNIQHSRTDKGKQNLDALFSHVFDHYYAENSATVGAKLGKVSVFEWDCANGGDAYADVEDLDALFQNGSALIPAAESRAINVFLVSTVFSSSSILGIAGGIGGPFINGTTASGLVFASFNLLDTYNDDCPSNGVCPIASQEPAFVDMGGTISHEMGHFLGLNHLSERAGTTHDQLTDTPACSRTQSTSIGSILTHNSCRDQDGSNTFPPTGLSCLAACPSYNGLTTFCPAAVECQFNHVMWWTSKNFSIIGTGQGDGNIFSTNSGAIINYSPYVR